MSVASAAGCGGGGEKAGRGGRTWAAVLADEGNRTSNKACGSAGTLCTTTEGVEQTADVMKLVP